MNLTVGAWSVLSCVPPAPPAPVTPPIPAATASQDSTSFDELIPYLLWETADPVLHPNEHRAAVRRAGDALARLQTVDTLSLSGPQRIDWHAVAAILEERIHDTAFAIWSRDPSRYLTLDDSFACPDQRGKLGAKAQDQLRGQLRQAQARLALGRTMVVDPAPDWIPVAIAASRKQAEVVRQSVRACVSRVPAGVRQLALDWVDSLAAATDAYMAFLPDTVRPAASAWAIGAEQYGWKTQLQTQLPYPPDSTIAAGRRMLALTTLALDSLAEQIRSGSGWRTLVLEMRSRHPEAGAVAAEYQRQSDQLLRQLTERELITIPRHPTLVFAAVKPTPRRVSPWAQYMGVRASRVLVKDVWPGMSEAEARSVLASQNHGWILGVAAHEGYPGHHLQFLYANQNPRYVRRYFGNSPYIEGWATYVEDWLAREGFFTTPDTRLAHLQMRLLRAARAIVDPSLHSGVMSYEQSVQFLVDAVGLERGAAEIEVTRFTRSPTQPSAYLIGWLEIERLRRDVETQLGDRYDHRIFVERVLELGPLPLALLRRAVLESYARDST